MGFEFSGDEIESGGGLEEGGGGGGEGSQSRRKRKQADAPVANEHLPLFPGSDKRSSRYVEQVRVYKLTGDDAGYKGAVGPEATEEVIAHQFGNHAVYRMVAVNAKGEPLRERNGVEISIGPQQPQNAAGDGGSAPSAMFAKIQHAEHREALQRQADQSKEITSTVREQSKQHADMVTEQSKLQAARDRDFYKTQTENQQQWFGQMMQAQQAQFQQTMAMMQQGHAQQMEQERAARERERLMYQHMAERDMTMLKYGVELGGSQGDPDEDPTLATIKAATSGLSELRQLATSDAKKRYVSNGAVPPNRQLPQAGGPQQQQQPAAGGEQRKSPLSREELVELVKLKRKCAELDLNFDAIISEQGREELLPVLAEFLHEQENGEDDGDEQDSEQGEGGGGEPQQQGAAAGSPNAGGDSPDAS